MRLTGCPSAARLTRLNETERCLVDFAWMVDFETWTYVWDHSENISLEYADHHILSSGWKLSSNQRLYVLIYGNTNTLAAHDCQDKSSSQIAV